MISTMASYLRILSFLVCFRGLYGQDKDNKCKYVSSEDISKDHGAHHSDANWSVLTHNNNVVDNVCVWQGYNPGNYPNGSNRTHLNLVLNEIRMVNVDDQKKTITLDLVALMIWKDDRIKARFTSSNNFIELPPMTMEEPSVIWTPFRDIQILKITKKRYLWDPYMINFGLRSVETASTVVGNISFSGHSLVVVSIISWSITISCTFEFSDFPFDKNSCPLILAFRNLDVSLGHSNDSMAEYTRQGVMDGYEIKQIEPRIYTNTRYGIYTTNVEIDIRLQRQWLTYLYQYYIPCITIVIASSFSFIIPITALPGRVALVVTQFLTLTHIFINQQVKDSA